LITASVLLASKDAGATNEEGGLTPPSFAFDPLMEIKKMRLVRFFSAFHAPETALCASLDIKGLMPR
jgi:hypothetical protein